MKLEILIECAASAHAGTMTFPQIVRTLLQIGVDSYHVDLVRSENRYYDSEGNSQVVPMPAKAPKAGQSFSAVAVSAAIKKSQKGEIEYGRFLDEITGAGCVYYIAYLAGKKVIYFGRNGDMHIELFPNTK